MAGEQRFHPGGREGALERERTGADEVARRDFVELAFPLGAADHRFDARLLEIAFHAGVARRARFRFERHVRGDQVVARGQRLSDGLQGRGWACLLASVARLALIAPSQVFLKPYARAAPRAVGRLGGLETPPRRGHA